MKPGLLIVVSGPSGAGKGTICRQLAAEMENVEISVSATTRIPREGEIEGKSYYFLTKDQFESKIKNGDFLEYANVYGNYYGTPCEKVQEKLKSEKDIILKKEIQGALNIKKI